MRCEWSVSNRTTTYNVQQGRYHIINKLGAKHSERTKPTAVQPYSVQGTGYSGASINVLASAPQSTTALALAEAVAVPVPVPALPVCACICAPQTKCAVAVAVRCLVGRIETAGCWLIQDRR